MQKKCRRPRRRQRQLWKPKLGCWTSAILPPTYPQLQWKPKRQVVNDNEGRLDGGTSSTIIPGEPEESATETPENVTTDPGQGRAAAAVQFPFGTANAEGISLGTAAAAQLDRNSTRAPASASRLISASDRGWLVSAIQGEANATKAELCRQSGPCLLRRC